MQYSESIILSKMQLGEADVLLTFFSRDGGKLKGVARNAKRSKKRFGGVLENGYVAGLGFTENPGRELVSITDAKLVSPTSPMVKSLGATYALWLALSIASAFLPDSERNGAKYELLKRFVLAVHEGRLNRAVLVYFLFRWIALCGYQPELENCVKCGREAAVFSAVHGGVLCGKCGAHARAVHELRGGSVEALGRIMAGDMRLQLGDAHFSDLMDFIFYYAKALIAKPLEMESCVPMLMDIEK